MAAPVFDAARAGETLPDRDVHDYLKAYLADTQEALRKEQRETLAGGTAAARRYADAVDEVIRALYARGRRRFLETAPDLQYRLCVASVGGYGRRELCPKSDIDLLFLHPYKVDRYVEAVTESILYPLWDLGMDVGHSVRSVRETLRMAAADDSVRTALLDCRLITGDGEFFREAIGEIERFLFFSGADRFIAGKLEEMRTRHERFGATVYVLEPNVKEGKGGLRDLQTAIWCARIKYKCRNLKELRNKGVLGAKTIRAADHAQDWLLRVRNELHLLTGKKSDVLTFEVQDRMAGIFGYHSRGRDLAVERFMRTYYMNAAMTAHLSEEILEQVDRYLSEGIRGRIRFLQRKKVGEVGVLYKGKMYPLGGVSFRQDPRKIFAFFRAMQQTRSALSAEAKQAIQRALPAIGPGFREDPESFRRFLEILGDPRHLRETLSAMHECRFLGRFIPEFASLSFRVQRDIYHVYTVDIHLIRATSVLARIETLGARTKEEADFLALYRTIPRKDLLHLAILLHDIGKGRGHGHSRIGAGLVREIGGRLGLSMRQLEDLVFLVEHHLLMAHIAQRRDLHDIELILGFAETVGTVRRLDMLYLLTYADLRAVGPEVWNQWKAMLLAELYAKARNFLETGSLKRMVEEEPRRRRERVAELLGEFPEDEVRRFLSRFDDRYFLATPDARFPDHYRILREYDGRTPRVRLADFPESGASEILIACPDQHGLFSKIAGTLSANGFNILNATISTSNDGVALDSFYVDYLGRPLRDDPKGERVSADLVAVLRGDASVERLLAERLPSRFTREKVSRYRPTRVVFDNDASSRYTVVDIFTYDRIGLLYDITRTFSELGIDIVLAKISTKADQVADVFYLKHRDGGKIHRPAELEDLRAALLAAIGE
ncbi:MAG: [protein-PII] uridylyltransferase [Deltaproteobacteria bacterium]